MKRCVAFCLFVAGSWLHAADPQPLQLRQVIIRAPEMDVMTWAADPGMTEAKLAERLWLEVREGRARVMSDVAGAVDDSQRAVLKTGHGVWLPTELDQDVDNLFMTPTAYREFSIGTSVECNAGAEIDSEPPHRIGANWLSKFSPRGPLAVQWPSSWLNVYENEKMTDKLIHGWLDWHDLFEESVAGSISFHPGVPTVLAILPPADQVWPEKSQTNDRLLDVFIAQMGEPVVDAPERPSPRTLLFGIALPSGAALDLLAKRQPADDEALLANLLAKVDAGAARMVFTAGSPNDPFASSRATLTSARLHAYPTEMPSIPSAWDEVPVGTVWESEANVVALHQDLAPPARTEWRLAQDVPAAIMWEPRFRSLDLRASHGVVSGTCLLSSMRVPEVMRGAGLDSDETILIFAKHRAVTRQIIQGPVTNDPFAPGGHLFTTPVEYEAEMFVFEVPAQEAADWQPGSFGSAEQSDQVRLESLFRRVQAGTASLSGHVLIRAPFGQRTTCQVVEQYQTATEFDPPELPTSPRMRPTALETLPVGSRWELDVSNHAADSSNFTINHTFEHSTAKPVEPPLAETLAIAARDSHDYPGAIHHQLSWKGSLTLSPDQPLCLGAQKPPGVSKEVLQVAFLRMRKL